jgi:hypothetical protein
MKHAAALRTIREALIRADAHEALDALDSIERESLQSMASSFFTRATEKTPLQPESPMLKRYTWTVRKTEARYFANEAVITIGGIEGEIAIDVRPNWDVSPDTGNLRYTETLEQVIARYVGKTYGVTIEESSA